MILTVCCLATLEEMCLRSNLSESMLLNVYSDANMEFGICISSEKHLVSDLGSLTVYSLDGEYSVALL